MQPFIHENPTRVFFGPGMIEQAAVKANSLDMAVSNVLFHAELLKESGW